MIMSCLEAYQQERDQLSTEEINAILQAGRRWNFGKNLASGDVVIFPHTYLHVCAAQIAASVHGALDSGADQVLALGVLHSLTDEFVAARAKEKAMKDLSDLPYWGVHGPRIDRGPYWKSEYSLLSFCFLWDEEIKRRGIKAPKLTLRFPYLVNRQPDKLPGIKELEAMAKDACIVATCDFCHHGVAYGMTQQTTLTGQAALSFAKRNIETNLQILQMGDLGKYYQHCQEIRSDSLDVCSVLYHLRGSMNGTLLDLALGDVAPLFEGNPSPSWVAAALIHLQK